MATTLALLLAAVAICSNACTSKKPFVKEATPVVSGSPNTTFPKLSLDTRPGLGWVLSDGKRTTLADYHGRVLVLDFYATWCVPCRQSIPHLNSLKQNYAVKDVEIVGLNVGGPDDRIKVADFAKELNIGYPLGFPDRTLTDLFLADNQTIPQTFVFGRDGRLVKRFIGYEEATGIELEKIISEAVNKKP